VEGKVVIALPRTLPSRERDGQWAGQGPFRLVLQALFVAAHEDDAPNDEEHGQHEEHDTDRPDQPDKLLTYWGSIPPLSAASLGPLLAELQALLA
jgi:hypothetical protein